MKIAKPYTTTNLTFAVQFAYVSTRPKKGFVFRATFEQFRYKKKLLSIFFFKKLKHKFIRKSRATCGKP